MGEFDPDEFIRRRRERESFGVRYDPRTQSHVEFPLIPRDTELLRATAQASSPASTPPERPVGGRPDDENASALLSCLARMILGAVASRPFLMGVESTVRFIRGGMTRQSVRHALHKRNMFGIGAGFPPAFLRGCIEGLMDDGLLGAFPSRIYGTDALLVIGTKEGDAFLRGGKSVNFEAFRKLVFPSDAGFTEEQARLFERLRATRTKLAERHEVPPFGVAPDRVLDALARRAPKKLEEIGQLPGVGPIFMERYAAEFLTTLNDGSSESSRA